MAVRKSTVYFFVIVFVAAWFGLIIYSGYDDKRLTATFTAATLVHANPAEFQLYGVLNARPDSAPLAPGHANSLLVVLRNRLPGATQYLLAPRDEFSALIVEVRRHGVSECTFRQPAGNPDAGVEIDSDGQKVMPLWHTLALAPLQAVAKEVVLDKKAFPAPGVYDITLIWKTDDFEKLDGHVAPIDRQSKALALTITQTVTIPAPAAAAPRPDAPGLPAPHEPAVTNR